MATIVTFCILAAAGVASWWLLRDVLFAAGSSRGPKCPVCGGRSTEAIGAARRCASCGARFRPHGPLHLREPTLPAVSLLLLAFIALLAFALSDLALHWQIVGEARAALWSAAAAAGIAAAITRIVHHRGQARRN